MKNSCKVMIIMIFIFALFVPMQISVKASTFASMNPKKDVLVDKPWTVSFNKPLSTSSVNPTNIKLVGESNKNIDIKVTLANGNKNVIVQPVKDYEYSKSYTLIVTQKVTCEDGQPLGKEVRMNFDAKAAPTKSSEITVCIDPAQYYTENTGSGGVKAKDINLSTALKLGNILKTRGFNVVYTRTKDEVSWNKANEDDAKATIAKNAKANVFLSVNINSASNTEAKGIETYYMTDSNSNKLLASSMQVELLKATSAKDRGIQVAGETANFAILKKISCPAIVLELGFLSNAEEELLLSSTEYQNNAAKAIANGLMNYAGFKNTDTNYDPILKVSSVPDIKVSLEEGGRYSFPKTLQATMSNNLKKEVQVQWPLEIVYLTEAGTYTYEGVIKDYDKKVKAIIQVSKKQTEDEEPIYINDIVENIKKGDNYSLPSKVMATTDKGEEKEVDVVWDNKLDTSKVGVYTFVGTIIGRTIKVNLLINVTESVKGSYKVVLDPGHGGNDPGAIGAMGTKEKAIVLSISLKVGNILVKNGVETIYTRTTDKTQSLQEKCDVSNAAKPDLFVSIHANSYTSSTVSGIETFYSSGNAAGAKLAQAVQTELIKETGRVDRKVKTANFYVLNNTDATAILVETSFLSNPEEEKLLGTNAYQDKLAKAISTGILKSLGITNIIY
ncbi:N-acetylmuramoyl-L-alanine amidase [Clostridium sp. CS001]|uniref:N-acetylmuramoyl-L-alanine amidase n=1 Tax=Clostridium sp. CS001 TaxID=2880648 RepID=UPI001CF31B39|nr:N-acetylmuramoyl-L-alanine amidase [Clostridium sp. CS001]MCB2291720.1 N-acetylmuramoyl-L-alanine amidase [Clostridium sp. CS001]